MEGKKSNDDAPADAPGPSLPSSASPSVAVDSSSAGGESSAKCKVCKKRLGRRNCPHLACVQCCTDPTCEPHREARAALKKKESILDGTDGITRAAAKKRASKVAPGMFHDADIQYFGETVVIWDVREFMRVQKWREDAMRRSRHRKGGGDVVVDLDVTKKKARRKRRRSTDDDVKDDRDEEKAGEASNGEGEVNVDGEERKGAKKPMSRKKRFRMIMDRLYRESLEMDAK